jgi:spore photoproduct lyase
MKDYGRKWRAVRQQNLYPLLALRTRSFLRRSAFRYRFTHQEFRKLTLVARDLDMWDEWPLEDWWRATEADLKSELGKRTGLGRKELILARLDLWYTSLKEKPKLYPPGGLPPPPRPKRRFILENTNREICGPCPVASSDTLCCNLYTVDAALSCAFGCSYCTIQTFYGKHATFDNDFGRKLRDISLDEGRLYHIGSGQSSDSLLWGNRYNILEDLLRFAERHSNVLLELKTKSVNIGYLLENRPPPNVVVSWSLNTETIIRNEEHHTPPLEKRLAAARQLADRHLKVAFHFHPMVSYQGWQEEYRQAADMVMAQFDPEEVLFVSYGSVTLIKPVVDQIRRTGGKSKILQMPLIPDPKGKMTYPDATKVTMYSHLYGAFAPWHDRAYFYLCMEKPAIWRRVFGAVYESNREFERDFLQRTLMPLIARS